MTDVLANSRAIMTEVIAALIGAIGAVTAAWLTTRRPRDDRNDDQHPAADRS